MSLIAPLLFCLPAVAQMPSATNPLAAVRTIDLSNEIPLPGLPPSSVLGSRTCSSDGDIYLEMYGDSPMNVYPDLYRVSSQSEIKHIAQPVPDGYKQIRSTGGFYAGASTLVSLINAAGPKEGGPKARPYGNMFLSVTDKDGDHGKVIPLDLTFEPIKVAVFDSGEFIVLGIAANENRPILEILHDDGTVDRQLDLSSGPRPTDGDPDPTQDRKKWAQAHFAASRSLREAEFVPYGSEILLIRPDSTAPIERIRPISQKEIRVQVPDGYALQSVLASGPRDTWVIRTQSEADFKTFREKSVLENPDQHLFEVNPQTGEVMKELVVKGRKPFSVLCAVDGKLAAIDLSFSGDGQPDTPGRFVYSSALR